MSPYTFDKYPYECDHPLDRREYLPNETAPKMVTCLDCGAILFMQIAEGQMWKAVPVPLAARLFVANQDRQP